jgi:serine/threonine-protein kinase
MLTSGAFINDRYRLLHVLGEGGMGAVWAARNEVIGRDVALKLMLPELSKDRQATQRFFNEARICASIRDPSIVDVLDFGYTERGAPYIVMELLTGESLEALVLRERRLTPATLLPIVRDVAAALQLAHDKTIVHRDLKPSNLFLHRTPRGQMIPKILDFGISKVLSDPSTRMTRTGAVIGTPVYMSPEQASGKVVDHLSDIYALGAIMYEALSGHLPFADDSYNALIVAIATQTPQPLASLVADLPPGLVELVEGCMARDRKARIQTAAEIAERVGELMGLAQPLASQPSHPSTQILVTRHGTALTPDQALTPTRTHPTPSDVHTTLDSGSNRDIAAHLLHTGVPLSRTLGGASKRRPLLLVLGAVVLLSSLAAVGIWRGYADAEPVAEPAASETAQPSLPPVVELPSPVETNAEASETSAPSASASAAPVPTAKSIRRPPPPRPVATPPKSSGDPWGRE